MGRGLDVLAALSDLLRAGTRPTVGEIARVLDRERSQVSRTLATLLESGHIVRRDDRSFDLSWRWYSTAQELTVQRMRTHGLPALQELSARLGEATFLSVLRGATTVTTMESLPAGSRMIGSWIERAYPAYCSDAGRATLWDATAEEIDAVFEATEFTPHTPRTPRSAAEFAARLDDDRRRGFSIVDQEAEPGLFSVAAPVWDFRGEVVAAIQVVGTHEALSARVDECGTACGEAARAVSRALGAPERVEV